MSKPDLKKSYEILGKFQDTVYPDEKVLKFLEAGKLTGGGAR